MVHRHRSTEPASSWSRLLVLLALVVLTGVLLGLASRPGFVERAPRPRQAADAVLAGDLLYRAGEFVQQQSKQNPDIAWYAGYLLSQRGMSVWERRALGSVPDPDAALRLGIIYSRAGYREQGREMLRRAGEMDTARYHVYWGLVRLYAEDPHDRAGLVPLLGSLGDCPRWLRELVAVDLYEVVGSTPDAARARAVWRAHLNRFGLILVALEVVTGALVLAGALTALVWLGQRIFTLPTRRWRAPLRVPWGLWEATEVFAVAVFLMVLVSVGLSVLPWTRGVGRQGGMLPALLLLSAYCLYMGAALAMAWRRAGQPYPWRMLGVRSLPLGGTLRPALRTYALLLFLLTPAASYAVHHYLSVSNVFFRGGESLGAYATYFVLVCVLAPVAEEILFRGFLYPGLRRSFSPGWAALISALAFTGAHLPTPSAAALLVIALGYALALLYENTRSLLPCMVVHALHNTLVFFTMLAVMAL